MGLVAIAFATAGGTVLAIVQCSPHRRRAAVARQLTLAARPSVRRHPPCQRHRQIDRPVRLFQRRRHRYRLSGHGRNGRAGQCQRHVTERAVFQLMPDGLQLVDAPEGIMIEGDILRRMPFAVTLSAPMADRLASEQQAA